MADLVFVAIVSHTGGSAILNLYPCREKWKRAVPADILIKLFTVPADLEQLSEVIEPARLRAIERGDEGIHYEILYKGRLV